VVWEGGSRKAPPYPDLGLLFLFVGAPGAEVVLPNLVAAAEHADAHHH